MVELCEPQFSVTTKVTPDYSHITKDALCLGKKKNLPANVDVLHEVS
jgi:hypothetical protein